MTPFRKRYAFPNENSWPPSIFPYTGYGSQMQRMISCRGIFYFTGLYLCTAGAAMQWGYPTGLMVLGAGYILAAAVKHEEVVCE